MTKLLMTCGAVVLLAACASQPATTGSTSTPTAAPAAGTSAAVADTKPQQGKLVCEDSEQIGSHFRSRVCMTAEQAAERKKAAQDAFRNHSGISQCNDSGCAGGSGPPRR